MSISETCNHIFEATTALYHKHDDVNAHVENPYPECTIENLLFTKNWIDEEYRKGRTTTISEEEMFKLVREYMPELF